MTSVLSLGARMVATADERTRADLAMDRYADGEEAAFAVLYDELAPRLFRLALGETRSRSAAEDLVQQTFLQLHAARGRFLRGAAVLPWAYAIARRLLIDGHRRAAHEPRAPAREPGAGEVEGLDGAAQPAPEGSPEEALDRHRRELALQRDLEALPASHREAFSLVRLQGLSVAEAAELLGTTPGNVKIRTHRAAEALRQADAQRTRQP